MSYAVNGVQNVAVSVGTGGPMLAPGRLEQLLSDVPTPRAGNAVMVFALP